jgi:hypothetical protein
VRLKLFPPSFASVAPENPRLVRRNRRGAAGSYWRVIKELLAPRASFEGRVRKGARDLVNSLLNYGYGILSSRLKPTIICESVWSVQDIYDHGDTGNLAACMR